MASNDFEHEALANITEATLKNLGELQERRNSTLANQKKRLIG